MDALKVAESPHLLGAFLRSERKRLCSSSSSIGMLRRLQTRIGRPVTQEEIAEAAGVTREWYSRIESGALGALTPSLAYRLADIFCFRGEQRTKFFALALPDIPTVDSTLELRDYARHVAFASSFFEAASLAAETLNRALRANCISVATLHGDAGREPQAHTAGPRKSDWSDDSTSIVLDAHATLRHGGVGLSDDVPAAEAAVLRTDVPMRFANTEADAEYRYQCENDRWRRFNQTLRVRSVLAVPLFEREAFRGVLSCGWLERRPAMPVEIHLMQALSAITALVSRPF